MVLTEVEFISVSGMGYDTPKTYFYETSLESMNNPMKAALCDTAYFVL